MQTVHKLSKISALILLASASASATANSETKAKASIDLNLRYEAVDQDNTKKEASAAVEAARNVDGVTKVIRVMELIPLN